MHRTAGSEESSWTSGDLLVMEKAFFGRELAFRMMHACDENVILVAGSPWASAWALEIKAVRDNLAGKEAALDRRQRRWSHCCCRTQGRVCPRYFCTLGILSRTVDVFDFLDDDLLVDVELAPGGDNAYEPGDVWLDKRSVGKDDHNSGSVLSHDVSCGCEEARGVKVSDSFERNPLRCVQ